MAMNFFESQEAARRTSRRLIGLFVMAVAGVVIAVDIGVFMLAAGDGSSPGTVAGLVFLATVVTLAVIGVSSMIRTAGLRSGGGKVAVELGGTLVPEDTRDPHYRRLRNVVEEMSIASGVPVPEIYVLEEEPGINAFAAGWTPATAAVTVTRGALECLNRDELQGVIAHEYSHILNGDMRLNIRLIGVLFGILVLGIIGRKLLTNMRGSRGRDAVPIWLIALVLLIVGYVGLFFGRLIKAGLSRQREYLADASAVQFTRQTRGIAGALKKIGGLVDGSKLAAADAEEASHMFFGDGVGYGDLFATHPPLLKRIQALEPGFNADAMDRLSIGWAQSPPDGMEEDASLGLTGATSALAPISKPMPAAHTVVALQGAAVVAQAGTPADPHFDQAAAIHAALPEVLQDAARSLQAAVPLVLALLLDADVGVRAQQEGIIRQRHGDAILAAANGLRAHIEDLHPALRLPLACLAFPALRRRPRPELEAFIASIDALADADGQISLFEYCLGCLLHRQLRESLDPSAYFVAGLKKLPEAANEITLLLAVVAQYGADTPDDARRAYLAGMQNVLPNANIAFVAQTEGAAALDPGWDTLDALDPMAKAALLEGLVATVAADGKVTVEEAELLRTVCGVLHCPLPPLLGG